MDRRHLIAGLAAGALLPALAACSRSTSTASASASASGTPSASTGATAAAVNAESATGSLVFSHATWSYDATNDVYYQLGRYYVKKPAAKDYESLGVYVPGKYLTATKNTDGTYTASINKTGAVGGFTATTAPMVMPVNTPGYAAQKPPTSYSYSDVSSYLKAGFVYVAAGLRGRDSETSTYTGNAPWGVTDLKAAVRYLRYNAAVIPGDPDRVFVFGMSGGGAQVAVAGTTGDSALYTPYLKTLGAALTDASGKTISDAVAGVMAWCPITSLDYANAAYEWNMGQFASTGTRASGTWTKAYSADLATAFVAYINKLKLKGTTGTALTLTKSATGQCLAGSYYDNLVSVINTSLNDFLGVTTFPYTPSSMGGMGGMGGGGMSGAPSGKGAPTGSPPAGGGALSGGGMPSTAATPSTSGGAAGATSSSSTTYKTVEDYIDYLNTDSTWVSYDANSKKATVLNLEGFVKSQKSATKDVGAFDGITRQETENVVMGLGTSGLHFAPVSRAVIAARAAAYAKFSDWKVAYAAPAYSTDFAKADTVGANVLTRVNMYNPMYFLTSAYSGFRTTKVAPHWRIRTGIMQGDTANTTEINLTLALANLGKKVDFATIWGEGHTMAELTGSPVTNFITWVKSSIA